MQLQTFCFKSQFVIQKVLIFKIRQLVMFENTYKIMSIFCTFSLWQDPHRPWLRLYSR